MLVVTGAAIATVDPAGTEHRSGHLVVGDDGRIAAVGPGDVPAGLLEQLAGGDPGEVQRVDGTGCLATPAWSTPTTICTSGPPGGSPSRTPCSAG